MIMQMLRRLDNAYPTADDRAAVEGYLATVDDRRAALDEVKRVAGPVAEKVIAGMRDRYPQFARRRTNGFEKAQRDIGMLTQLAGNSMFMGEDETMDDMFTVWFQTILKGVHMSPQFMRDAFDLWLEHLRAMLPATAFSLLRPHAEHMAAVLTDLPVPARDETGARRP